MASACFFAIVQDIQDITERKRAREEIAYFTSHAADPFSKTRAVINPLLSLGSYIHWINHERVALRSSHMG